MKAFIEAEKVPRIAEKGYPLKEPIDYAKAVFNAATAKSTGSRGIDFLFGLHAVLIAGYIAGVRAERQKKRE